MWAGVHWSAVGAAAGVALLALLVRRRRAILLALCLLALLGGILRFHSTVPAVDENALRFCNDAGVVRVKGLVATDPQPQESAVALRLEATELSLEGAATEVSGAVLVYAPRFPSPSFLPPEVSRDSPYYRYGDLVVVEGRLETPPDLGGSDWQEYLARGGVQSLIRHPDRIELLATGQGFKPQELLYQLRDRMSQSLEETLHEPQASLAQAILLGKRTAIPDEVRESLSQTGTAHVIAVSGLHVGIAGGIMLSLGVWRFGRRRPTYFLLAVGAVWIYAFLTGLHTPSMRAAIMVSLWLFADYIGRPRSAVTILVFTAAIMVGLNPSVIHEVSFRLSFAAMTGLVLLTPRFQSLGRRALGTTDEGRTFCNFVIDSFSVTLGAVLATLPVLAYYFHQISLVSLPANLVALPALPGVIVTSALVAVVGLFAVPLAQVLGWVAWLFITYMMKVVEVFSVFPALSVEVGAPFVWGCYVILGVGLWAVSNRARVGRIMVRMRASLSGVSYRLRRAPAKLVVLPLLIVAALVWTAAITSPDGKLHVFFLDVGQGDAILIQKGHQQILVDGGPDAGRICHELGDKLPFWDRTIELVIATHPDADHLGGLVEVLRRYEVGRVLTSGQQSESSVYAEWLRLVGEEEAELTFARAGQRIQMTEDIVLEVLHPQGALLQGTPSDIDNNSVVTRLVFRDFSVLLTGDIFEEAEQHLLDRRFSLRAAVLKVPHHGSQSSSCPEFIAEVNPQMAVVSVGAENPFRHPDAAVIDRLMARVGEDNVFLTSESGTIELITDGERLWVQTER